MPRISKSKQPQTVQEIDAFVKDLERQKQEALWRKQQLEREEQSRIVATKALEVLRTEAERLGVNFLDAVATFMRLASDDDDLFARNGIDY